MNAIYDYILERGTLTQCHRDELSIKRGFTDATISSHRFFSGGDYFLKVERELLEKFSEEDLVASGVFTSLSGKIAISSQLCEDRIIIPYLDKAGGCHLIRPHKLGFKNIGVEVYGAPYTGEKIILTEGEFKAAACHQLGLNAVAIPGISVFSDKHFPKLVSFLQESNVKNICIIFDNEIKDNPKFPNYKTDPTKRWDTQYFAWSLAQMLDRESFDVTIGTIPDSWRVDGKADLDSALAQGHSAKEFRRIIITAQTYRSYYDSLCDEAKQIINRKVKNKYFRTHIREDHGKYVATRWRGKQEYEEVISNFVIRIIATYDTPEGVVRQIQFVNEFKESTGAFNITAEDMARSDSFSTFALSKGNFIWRGLREDLSNIWERLFLNDSGKKIYIPDHVGWIDSEKMWLFGNFAYKGDEELRCDENGIFWVGDKGYKPTPLGVTSGGATIEEGVPTINLKEFNFIEWKEKFLEALSPHKGRVLLGWAVSLLFFEDVFKQFGCFPFLFLHGKKGSGKSAAGRWVMGLFGVEKEGISLAGTTQVALQRYLGYNSSLPVFMDEYRNTNAIVNKDSLMRSAYNRQSAGKGIKADFGLRVQKVRGTLLIGGEETPNDNALLTRCIPIFIRERDREVNNFHWLQSRISESSAFVPLVLRQKSSISEKYFSIMAEAGKYFVSCGHDERSAFNWSVIASGYASFFGEDRTFASWMSEETIRIKHEQEEEHIIKEFMDELVYLRTRRLINEDYYRVDESRVFIYLRGVYNVWSQEYRKTRADEPFKYSAILDYIKDESGFIEYNVNHRINGSIVKCVVFNYDTAPQEIRALVDVTSTD